MTAADHDNMDNKINPTDKHEKKKKKREKKEEKKRGPFLKRLAGLNRNKITLRVKTVWVLNTVQWYKHKKVQKNAIYWDKTQQANFRGNPICQAAKRHLNNS